MPIPCPLLPALWLCRLKGWPNATPAVHKIPTTSKLMIEGFMFCEVVAESARRCGVISTGKLPSQRPYLAEKVERSGNYDEIVRSRLFHHHAQCRPGILDDFC